MKYTIWFMGKIIEEDTPHKAMVKAYIDAKNGWMMVDEVVDSDGIIQISSDHKRIGTKRLEK